MSSGLYSGVSGLALGVGLYRNVSGLWGGASGLIDGFGGGSNPYSGASLYLDFLTMTAPTFDSRITFSRGTNATLVDSTGRVTFAPNNTFTNSVGAASSTGVTASTASGAAPDGTNAVRLTKTDATTPRYSNWTTSFTVQGNTAYVASAYFKYDGFDTTVSLEYNNTTNFGIGWVATFNVTASGITANTPSSCTSGVQAVGNGWFRVWAAFTSGTPSTPTNPFVLTRITGGTSTTVLVAWGQLEQVTYQTTPSTYVATTSAAYYGPRFDYDPVTRAPRGLLIEEQRTNLLLRSEEFDNASWTKLNATVTANATTSPDGTVDADFVVADTTNAQHGVYQAATAVSGTTYTHSVYAKAGGYNWLYMTEGNNVTAQASFNLATGALGTVSGTGSPSATITPVGNGWYRCTLTLTPISTVQNFQCRAANANGGGSFTGDGTSGIFVWGAQLEAGAFATSYIPTVASTVTRNADVATMTGTNFSDWYNQSEGTFVVAGSSFTVPSFSYPLLASDNSFANRFGIYTSSSSAAGLVVSSSVTQMDISASSIVANVPFKAAVAAQTNSGNFSFNGSIGTTDTTITMPVVNRLTIGAGFVGTGEYINGHIRTIVYFNTRQPNTQLQTLTAPALVPSLSLDFINNVYNVGF